MTVWRCAVEHGPMPPQWCTRATGEGGQVSPKPFSPTQIPTSSCAVLCCPDWLVWGVGRGSAWCSTQLENIMMVSEHPMDLSVKLIDFGAACRTDKSGRRGRRRASCCVGSVQYMAPETVVAYVICTFRRMRHPVDRCSCGASVWSLPRSLPPPPSHGKACGS